MKKIKYIILILIIILALLILILCKTNKKKESQEIIKSEEPIYEISAKIKLVTDKQQYFTVKNYIKEFINYCIENNSLAIKEICKASRTDEIIEEFLYENSNEIYIEEIKVLEGYTYNQYFIKGKENINSDKTFYLNLNFDYSNYTYEINVLNENQYEKNLTTAKVIEDKEILKNRYNEFKEELINDEYIAIEYFDDYKNKMLNNAKIAYSFLDDNYKEKRFGNLEKFQEYIEKNRENIENSYIISYSVVGYEDYKEYVFLDNYNNYYTLKETSIMNYKILLDDYTILGEEFIEKYNRASNNQKVSTNVDIFIKMINSKDYESAYNLLDDGFKNNYFSTIDEFKNYVKENFYDYNYIVSNSVAEKNNIYQYEVTIKSGNTIDAYKMEKIFLVKLENGINFKVSFNID